MIVAPIGARVSPAANLRGIRYLGRLGRCLRPCNGRIDELAIHRTRDVLDASCMSPLKRGTCQRGYSREPRQSARRRETALAGSKA